MAKLLPNVERVLSAALALVLAATPIASQTQSGSDLAKQTFLNAEQLMRDGKTDQALRDYQMVVQSFPDSPWADDALLRIGSFRYPSESIEDLGKVQVDAQETARSFFDQVREKYPQSDSAPRALYKLGLLNLEPDSPRRNLDEAYASFYRVVNIYPDSDLVAGALIGAAVAEIGKRNYDSAILSLDRSLEESPHGSSAAESHYFLGVANARSGDFLRAAEAFQDCRIENEKSRAATRALDWLTLIYGLRLRPASGSAPEYVHDRSFVPRLPAGEELRGDLDLAVTPSMEILVADPRRGEVLVFSEDGDRGKSETVQGVVRVGVDAGGGTLFASPGQVRVGGKGFPAARRAGSSVRPVEEPGGVWRNSAKEIYLLDLKEGELLRYRDDPNDPKVVYRDKDAGTRLVAIAGGPEDRLFLLDAKGKSVLVLEGGAAKAVLRPGGGPALEDPVDLAVDALGDLFVLDARQRAVLILDPEGRKLARITPPQESLGELLEPAAVAVSPRGEVYVYDQKKRTILRYR